MMTEEQKTQLSNRIFKIFCAVNDKDETLTYNMLARKAKLEHISTQDYIIKSVVIPSNFMTIIERVIAEEKKK